MRNLCITGTVGSLMVESTVEFVAESNSRVYSRVLIVESTVEFFGSLPMDLKMIEIFFVLRTSQ
jgi:hypothetical protein